MMGSIERRRPQSQRIFGFLSTVVVAALALGWVAFLRPPALGGGTHYVIVSGTSMEPAMDGGDFVIALSQPSYDVGDVIVYHVPQGQPGAGSLIIHRVVGGSPEKGYVTKGDNPHIDRPDLWRPKPDDVAGKTWVVIPGVGKVLPYLRSPVVFGLAAGLFAFWIWMGRDEKLPAGPRLREEASP